MRILVRYYKILPSRIFYKKIIEMATELRYNYYVNSKLTPADFG